METNTTPNESKNQKLIGIGLVAILFILGLFWISAPESAASSTPSKVPEATKTYEALQDKATKALQEYCKLGWKPLAAAKIADSSNGHTQENTDLNKMDEIANKFDCSTVKAPSGF